MYSHCELNYARIRADGLFLSVGRRIGSGRLLRLSGENEISDALTDLPTLAEYAEVEIQGINGALPTYILTASLVTNPQIPLAFDLAGRPVLLGVKKATEGHISVIAPTRKGKTLLTSRRIAAPFNRLGIPVFYVGLKGMDNTPLASLKKAADSFTRLNKGGNRVQAPFAYYSLGQGVRTMGFNYLTQLDSNTPKWLATANILMGLGFTQDDPLRQYFTVSAHDRFEKTDWGESFVEFKANLDNTKVDRQTDYSTKGAGHQISIFSRLPHANLPANHPANIDVAKIINERGAVYCDFTYQEVGALATASAALFVQSVIFTKRRINPSKDHLVMIVIDEAQRYPRDLLAQLVEQAAASGIRLVLIYHGLEQMGDQWASIAMTQVMIILGAVPETDSERFLQGLFGTKKDYPFNFNGGSKQTSESYTVSEGPAGVSESFTKGVSHNEGSLGFSERETFVWTRNDTLELQDSPNLFVLRVSPGTEFAQYGARPIVCQFDTSSVNFAEINRLATDILKNTPNTFLPSEIGPQQIPAPEVPKELQEKRPQWLATLEKAAARVREAMA